MANSTWGQGMRTRVGWAAVALAIGIIGSTMPTAAVADEGPVPDRVGVSEGFLGSWNIVAIPPAGEVLYSPRMEIKIRVLGSEGDWLVADWDVCSRFPEGSRCYSTAYVFSPRITLRVPYEFSVRIRGEGTGFGPWSEVQELPVSDVNVLPPVIGVGSFWESRSVAVRGIARALGQAPGCAETWIWSTRKTVAIATIRPEPGCSDQGTVVLAKRKRSWTVVQRIPTDASKTEQRRVLRATLQKQKLPGAARRAAGPLLRVLREPELCYESQRCVIRIEPANRAQE